MGLGKNSKSSWGWLKFLCNPTDLHRAYLVLWLGVGLWGITTYNYSLWLPFFGGRGGDLLRETNSFGIIWWCCPDVSFDCSPLGVTDVCVCVCVCVSVCHFLPYMGKMFTHFWHTVCSRFFSVGAWNQPLDGLLTTKSCFLSCTWISDRLRNSTDSNNGWPPKGMAGIYKYVTPQLSGTHVRPTVYPSLLPYDILMMVLAEIVHQCMKLNWLWL